MNNICNLLRIKVSNHLYVRVKPREEKQSTQRKVYLHPNHIKAIPQKYSMKKIIIKFLDCFDLKKICLTRCIFFNLFCFLQG